MCIFSYVLTVNLWDRLGRGGADSSGRGTRPFMGHRHIPAPGAATSAVTGWGFANPGWGAETRRGRPSFPLIVRSRRVRVSRAAALAPAPRGTAAFGGAVAARTRHLRRPQDSFRKSGPGEFAGSQKMQRVRHLATEARGTRPRRAAGVRAESTCSGPARLAPSPFPPPGHRPGTRAIALRHGARRTEPSRTEGQPGREPPRLAWDHAASSGCPNAGLDHSYQTPGRWAWAQPSGLV